jgi:hypothetical protein
MQGLENCWGRYEQQMARAFQSAPSITTSCTNFQMMSGGSERKVLSLTFPCPLSTVPIDQYKVATHTLSLGEVGSWSKLMLARVKAVVSCCPVPRDSWPYFTCHTTPEAPQLGSLWPIPTYTRRSKSKLLYDWRSVSQYVLVEVKVTLRLTVSKSVCLGRSKSYFTTDGQ